MSLSRPPNKQFVSTESKPASQPIAASQSQPAGLRKYQLSIPYSGFFIFKVQTDNLNKRE